MHARKSHQGVMSVGSITDAIVRPSVPATRCLSSILLVLYLNGISATFPARQKDGNFRSTRIESNTITPALALTFCLSLGVVSRAR